MALPSGTRVGPYAIVAQLGAGGMGEVYRATDTKLKREVALKILPPSFAADPDRVARFQREAEVLASLNHPNIAHIHGLEDADGAKALVMELVEGPTLADRTARGPIPVDEALPIAKQIAEALEAAHEQGIIHRDLKPANIKVRSDGTVKVLDFGLARTLEPASAASADATASPTITLPAMLTGVGVLLGTAAYMSPEQARGKPVDKRSDIWSFGCVLYEMLTGRSVFAGDTVSDTIVTILEHEPNWSMLPHTTPPIVRRLLQRCLDKDQRRRLHDVADVRIEIEDLLTTPAAHWSAGPGLVPGVIGPTSSRTFPRTTVWVATFAIAVAVVALAALALRRPSTDLRPLRLSIVPPAGTAFTPQDISATPQFAVSPDGRQLAFVASAPHARPQLWVQQLESGAAQPLPGTDDATGPFWAPDSESLAFYARGKLKKVSPGGALPQELADVAVDVSSGAWNPDGVIIFGRATGDGLFRMSAEGGPGVAVTRLDEARGELSHRWPQFLPDGRRFIFHVRSSIPANTGVYLGSVDGGDKTQIIRSEANAVYSSSGHLLFEQAGNLMVQPFDATAGVLTGQASAFGANVSSRPGPSNLAVSIGTDGTMAYWNGQPDTTELQWFERNGRPLDTIGSAKPYQSPALSPDGKHVLITEQVTPSSAELSKIDLSTGVASRLTFPDGPVSFARFGVWSPEGTYIAYSSSLVDGPHIYQMTAGGADQESLPLGLHQSYFPEDWSRDGRWLVCTVTAKTGWDIWAFDFADRKLTPILVDSSNQLQARLSPNGRWIAYASDESGDWQVYVRPFPEGRIKRQVSSGGGSQPLWRGDGKELFYVAADARLVAVPIVGTDTFEVGVSQPLFATRIPAVVAPFRTNYAVSSDGQRFLVNSVTPRAAPAAITIAVNWQARWKK